MKKLLVLIVLLVFGLSFLVANSAARPVRVSVTDYYLVEPSVTTNTCQVEVYQSHNLSPHATSDPVFRLKIVGGNCQGPRPDNPGSLDVFIDGLPPILVDGQTPGNISIDTETEEGWFYHHNSPGEYCYVHPVTRQYQCIYW